MRNIIVGSLIGDGLRFRAAENVNVITYVFALLKIGRDWVQSRYIRDLDEFALTRLA